MVQPTAVGAPVAGPKSELLSLTRTDGERPRGSPALYCFGYADLMDLLELDDAWPIVEAVVDETLAPLSVAELVFCAEFGLDGLVDARARGTAVWRFFKRVRPREKPEVARAKPPYHEPIRGLGDLWALTTSDLRDQLGLAARKAWTATGSDELQMWRLPSIVEFCRRNLPGDLARRLGIEP